MIAIPKSKLRAARGGWRLCAVLLCSTAYTVVLVATYSYGSEGGPAAARVDL
jgi:hypothetical protein